MYIAWLFKNKVYIEDCANIGDEILNFIKNNYDYELEDTEEEAEQKLLFERGEKDV
jgi:hypothetical protein